MIYAVLAVYQTRLGLGLPLELRPTEDLHEYTLVTVPVLRRRALDNPCALVKLHGSTHICRGFDVLQDRRLPWCSEDP